MGNPDDGAARIALCGESIYAGEPVRKAQRVRFCSSCVRYVMLDAYSVQLRR